MKKILNAYDIFRVEGKGLAIAGTNPLLDGLNIDELIKIIGNKIVLFAPNMKPIYLEVLHVDISNSLLNKKNIFIIINDNGTIEEYKHIEGLEVFVE